MRKSSLTHPLAVEQRAVITDILSQAITGELIGMSNFATLAGAIDDVHEKMEAVEHANCERGHAEGFMHLAQVYGLEPVVNLNGYYWHTIRQCFLKYAAQQDFIACLIIQEVMLECFAVSMYHDVGQALDNEIGDLFTAISAEEQEHIEHSIELLQAELNKDMLGFFKKVEAIHWDCMSVLAEWTAQTDLKGHCGVCKSSCMKESLPAANLDMGRMRGNALKLYVKTLDRIGLPGQKTLQWIINLPA
jgi:rubrerythrin